MKDARLNIRNLGSDELGKAVSELGAPNFRMKQINDWIWNKGVRSINEMRNVPAEFKKMLEARFFLDAMSVTDVQTSSDGTVKCAFRTWDGHVIEGVLIPSAERMTACISSQVGCSLACTFCATGRLKMLRNLSPGEIFDQVHILNQLALEKTGLRLDNIVLMGMGEPLLNYKNVVAGINRITSPDGLGISPKRITVSTAGIAKMIVKLADDDVRFNLALSLHATNDRKRSEIMEINESNNLDSLREALSYFCQKTGSRITFEYIILKNYNDSLDDARELGRYCRNFPVKINIIEYNPIDNGPFVRAEAQKVNAFAQYLESLNLIVNIRRSRGKDIDAACGQLANKNVSVALKDRVLK